MNWLTLVIEFAVGGIVGIVIMCIVISGNKAERHNEMQKLILMGAKLYTEWANSLPTGDGASLISEEELLELVQPASQAFSKMYDMARQNGWLKREDGKLGIVEDEASVREVLEAGGRIWWDFINGEVVLLNSQGEDSKVRITSRQFFNLRDNGFIKEIGRMRQGHPLFRGPCIGYAKK